LEGYASEQWLQSSPQQSRASWDLATWRLLSHMVRTTTQAQSKSSYSWISGKCFCRPIKPPTPPTGENIVHVFLSHASRRTCSHSILTQLSCRQLELRPSLLSPFHYQHTLPNLFMQMSSEICVTLHCRPACWMKMQQFPWYLNSAQTQAHPAQAVKQVPYIF
jgi:hypothetical protein